MEELGRGRVWTWASVDVGEFWTWASFRCRRVSDEGRVLDVAEFMGGGGGGRVLNVSKF